MTRQLMAIALLALLLAPAAAFSQEPRYVELGFRGITGTVDSRTSSGGVPFSNGFRPDVLNSGVNTYNDYRDSFYIPRANIEKILRANNYFNLQAQSYGVAFNGSTFIRDQALLATVGRHGVYKVQFRWDQTPHIFSGTTRSLYSETSPGVWKYTGDRAALDAARVAGTATAYFNAVTPQVANAGLDVQSTIRKIGTALASWDINPNWEVDFLFAGEDQVGTRPHGMCFGNSPSCVWSEIPENLDYFTRTLNATTSFGQKAWEMQLGYWRQGFENNIPSMVVDNPFSNNNYSGTVTANGQMGLYPNNQAQNLQFDGALKLGRVHFMGSIRPGWVSQDDPFVPYTTNTFLLGRTGTATPIPLPVASLDGARTTLAMNYTVVFNPLKSVAFTARYRHYDHNSHTEEHVFNPYVNDLEAETQLTTPGGSGQETVEYGGIGGVIDPDCRGVCNEPISFHTKDLDLDATWFFTKRNSLKVQYLRQWFDRQHRDVGRTIEDVYKVAVDLKPTTDLTFRVSAVHQNREPQDTEYEWFLLPGTQRPDEGFRLRNRVDLLAQYDLTSRLSVSAFYGTTQDDYNRRDELTSLVPLGDPSLVSSTTARPTPTYGPYYVYGVQEDLSWSWGGDFDVLLGEDVTVFGEYARDSGSNRLVSRQRSANTASQKGCPSVTTPQDCDPINDWMTVTDGVVDTYTIGTDLSVRKKLDVSLYYSLSAAQGTMSTDGVNCQVGQGPNDYCRTNFPNWRLDTAANRAVTFSFPETVSRLHELGTVVRFRLTDTLMPRFEYRYHRFEYTDFQTSVMNPYAFVGPAIDPAGTTGLQRMLFLGADTPGYKAHVFSVTLEYHF